MYFICVQNLRPKQIMFQDTEKWQSLEVSIFILFTTLDLYFVIFAQPKI
jgi:hypothetical protein